MSEEEGRMCPYLPHEVRVALIPQSERMVAALDKVVTDSNPGVVRLAMEAKALMHGLGG